MCWYVQSGSQVADMEHPASRVFTYAPDHHAFPWVCSCTFPSSRSVYICLHIAASLWAGFSISVSPSLTTRFVLFVRIKKPLPACPKAPSPKHRVCCVSSEPGAESLQPVTHQGEGWTRRCLLGRRTTDITAKPDEVACKLSYVTALTEHSHTGDGWKMKSGASSSRSDAAST